MTVTETLGQAEVTGPQPTIASEVRGYLDKVRGGDVGSLPAVAGLVVLVIFFSVLKPDLFPSNLNFANLLVQAAPVIFIAMGLIFVLLLGEIDLAAGYTAGTGGAVLCVLNTNHGVPWPLAVIGCALTGTVIGLIIGVLVARLGIPSFVVTLAAFLGLQGVLLLIVGEGGTIPMRDSTILAIMNKNLSPLGGWILFLVIVGGYATTAILGVRKRQQAGLPAVPPVVILTKVAVLAVILGAVTFALNQERGHQNAFIKSQSLKGVPIVVPVILVFLIALTFLLNRTSFGRHVFAVGGNAEAARRAGINVSGIRIACFAIESTLAALAGVLFVSYTNSVSAATGGSTTLLLAVGAAVIGGTSLFGGKGRIIDAILGGLVIAVIQNGLPFITQKAGVQFIVTGSVLLLAASVDAISRRRSATAAR
jgi:D-xylose transport system permease protein